MIGIRSITYNATRDYTDSQQLRTILKCSELWDTLYEPHTQRINLPESYEPLNLKTLRQTLTVCDYSSVRWVNTPLNPKNGNAAELAKNALDIVSLSGRAFVNFIGVDDGVIAPGAFKTYANLNRQVAGLDRSGVNNFRLGMSYNIGYDCPFFPFTRSKGDELSFTIALEMVQDVNTALKECGKDDLVGIREATLKAVGGQIDHIEELAHKVEKETGVPFKGFDFSLAPVIGNNGSIVTILNGLGVYNFGHTGTMFATSFLTDILKELARTHPSVGFHGVMYSLLEDLDLCIINNERGVTLEQFTSLATMCGCGLDMVPISGDVTPEEIYTCCMDIAAVSCKYDKPLGVRLLPIPGTKRGQKIRTSIEGDADFIANTRIVPLDVNLVPSQGTNFNYLTY